MRISVLDISLERGLILSNPTEDVETGLEGGIGGAGQSSTTLHAEHCIVCIDALTIRTFHIVEIF